MFRTQLASTISAARHNPAPTFWAAGVSFSPDSRQACAISSQPSRQNSRLSFGPGTFVLEQGKKAIMKKIKSTFFSALVIGVLCAGTVSARQLRSDAKGSATCGGSCGVNNPCRTGCLCIFPMETGSPFCSSHPIPGATVLK